MIDATEDPEVRTRVLNGVAVPGVEPEDGRDVYPDHEATVCDAFRRRVRRGDRVVVVGGGWGATTVVGARMTHFEGEVVAYEPSAEMVETLRRTVAVNRVEGVVDVRHAAVGSVSDSSERIFGEASGERVEPDELPACDVMDVDCEGAELYVLRGMDRRPRLLTVEAHPHLARVRRSKTSWTGSGIGSSSPWASRGTVGLRTTSRFGTRGDPVRADSTGLGESAGPGESTGP